MVVVFFFTLSLRAKKKSDLQVAREFPRRLGVGLDFRWSATISAARDCYIPKLAVSRRTVRPCKKNRPGEASVAVDGDDDQERRGDGEQDGDDPEEHLTQHEALAWCHSAVARECRAPASRDTWHSARALWAAGPPCLSRDTPYVSRHMDRLRRSLTSSAQRMAERPPGRANPAPAAHGNHGANGSEAFAPWTRPRSLVVRHGPSTTLGPHPTPRDAGRRSWQITGSSLGQAGAAVPHAHPLRATVPIG